jgi:hypothetical protein
MANETQKKRQKELARRERRQKKAARLLERRKEETKPVGALQEQKPESADSLLEAKAATKFGSPKYVSCSRGPRNPRKKSEVTLYAAKKITY